MLAKLVESRMKEKGLSLREVATEVGTSHTTIGRVLKGVMPDIDNLVKITNWLGVKLQDVIGVEYEDDIVGKGVSMLIESEPQLKEIFSRALGDVASGDLDPDDVRDIISYALFKIEQRKKS